MSPLIPARLLALVLLFLTLSLPHRSGAQIYADVTVAGAVNGTFTMTLEHVKTPGAVANFIGLATGQRGWLDLTTGAIRHDGFYNGVIFHRVIAGFVSQAGSRAGDGTDGPGYAVRDEIDATLRHDGAYVVAMANSGKNTNGSQFYITASPQPSLDGGYTIFGRVTAGMAVCDAINATPTNAANKPLAAVTIQAVSVYGPSLAGFDREPALLPKLSNAKPVLKKTGAVFSLEYDRRTFSEYPGWRGANLATWTKFNAAYFGAIPATAEIGVTASAVGAQHFYRLGRVDYATCATVDLGGNAWQFSNPLGGTAVLNAARTGGTWTLDGGTPTTLTSASFTPKPYTAQMFLALSNGNQFLLTLRYNTATGGTYSGQRFVQGFFTNVSGTFTLSP